jgi:8-oxo-dGTP pyrophosphatase MutT (NUDIX family)
MSKKIGAAAVILNSEGNVLLVKHTYGKYNWELPGGYSEKDESALETAKRETLEEAGIEVAVEQLTGVYYEPGSDMHHFVFLCTNVNNKLPSPSSKEISECRYFSTVDLPRPISDFTCQRIRDAIHFDSKHLFYDIGPRQWIE